MLRARAALAVFLLPLFAGCTSKVTAPVGTMSTQTADDMAIQAVASMGIMQGDLQFAIGTTPAAMARAREARPARAMWDTSYVVSGITFQASRAFYDALDNELPGYGPTAVRVRWTSHASGTYEGTRDTATVAHDAILDLTGIQAGQDTLQLNGVSQDTLQNRFLSLDGTRMRYFLWQSSTTVEAVRLLKSTYPAGYPLDGTVTFLVSADRLRSNNRSDVDVHFEATVVITFNGTAIPTIVVDGAYRYRWNLVTGTITRA